MAGASTASTSLCRLSPDSAPIALVPRQPTRVAQHVIDGAGYLDGAGGIGVDTDRFSDNPHVLAADRAGEAQIKGPADLVGHGFGRDRRMFARDDLTAVIVIVDVDAELAGEGNAAPGEDLGLPAVRIGDHRNAEDVGRIGDPFGHVLFVLGHAEKRSMGLDARQLHRLGAQKPRERAGLVDGQRRDLVARHAHRATAEPLAVRQAGTGADADIRDLRHPDGPRHHDRVRGMKPAGEVGKGDVGHAGFIIAEAVDAERLGLGRSGAVCQTGAVARCRAPRPGPACPGCLQTRAGLGVTDWEALGQAESLGNRPAPSGQAP